MDRKTILIAVLCNNGLIPDYFFTDFLGMYDYTRSKGYRLIVQRFSQANLSEMKNQACLASLGKKFSITKEKVDYLFMMELDHRFEPDCLVKLIEIDKEVSCGSTYTRIPPYSPTQFKKMLTVGLKSPENTIVPEGSEPIKIEGSGTAGILIKISVLEKMKWPYFEVEHYGEDSFRSSDLSFFNKLRDLGVEVYLHPEVIFPHNCRGLFSSVSGLSFLE
jgi:hypothetical protein